MHSETSEARWLLTCSCLSCVPFLPEKANLREREFCLVIRTWTFSRRATWRQQCVCIASTPLLPHHSPLLLASIDIVHLYLLLFSIGQTFYHCDRAFDPSNFREESFVLVHSSEVSVCCNRKDPVEQRQWESRNRLWRDRSFKGSSSLTLFAPLNCLLRFWFIRLLNLLR